MRSVSTFAIAGTAALLSLGCGDSPAEPPRLDLAGTWSGSGSDSQGAEVFTWVLTQAGATVSGPVTSLASDPKDGSCASCHKNKLGVLTGTISNGILTIAMSFPTGGDVPTPICSVTMNASTTAVTSKQIFANYSGGDSCEGPFTNGAFTMVKRP